MVCAHRHCAGSARKARLRCVPRSLAVALRTRQDAVMLTTACRIVYLEADKRHVGAVNKTRSLGACRPQLVKGFMQLYSVEQKRSQALEAHAAAFSTIKVMFSPARGACRLRRSP